MTVSYEFPLDGGTFPGDVIVDGEGTRPVLSLYLQAVKGVLPHCGYFLSVCGDDERLSLIIV